MDNRGKRQAASIFGGMGFYIALLVCVVAAGVVPENTSAAKCPCQGMLTSARVSPVLRMAAVTSSPSVRAKARTTIRENYPPPAFYSGMNMLGTHDTPRILTMLGARNVPEDRSAPSSSCPQG